MAAIVRNFLFHRVSNEADTMWPPMKPKLFERIITALTKNYTVVPLEHYLDDAGAFDSRKKIATVLFDDGYKDNLEMAAPILSKYKCPASFYVVTDCIDRNIPTWTYILDDRFSKTRKEKIELDFDFVPQKFKVVVLNDTGTNKKEIKPWLKKLSNRQRQLVLENILQQCDDVSLPQNRMMNWGEVKQLANEGFIIGSHSHTHPMLASLQNENEIKEELTVSGEKIKTELGFFPATISYPIGSFDERVTKLAKETGYKYGLAVEQQFYQSSKNDLYKIPRVELYQEPWWKVQMRMKGFYSAIKNITG
jgi:peptidoglycan/xylan/chitin deacetylase (PgdA/CDA1 family)